MKLWQQQGGVCATAILSSTHVISSTLATSAYTSLKKAVRARPASLSSMMTSGCVQSRRSTSAHCARGEQLAQLLLRGSARTAAWSCLVLVVLDHRGAQPRTPRPPVCAHSLQRSLCASALRISLWGAAVRRMVTGVGPREDFVRCSHIISFCLYGQVITRRSATSSVLVKFYVDGAHFCSCRSSVPGTNYLAS